MTILRTAPVAAAGFAAAVLCLAGLSGAGSPARSEQPRDDRVASAQPLEEFDDFGISQGFQPLTLPDDRLGDLLDRVAATGSTAIRLDLSWGQIQAGGRDAFDFANTIRVFDAAIERDLDVLPVTSGIPAWAGSIAPTSAASYERFMYEAGKVLIPRGVTTVELWNEANLTGMSPATYTSRVLIPGAAGFRAAGKELGVDVSILSTGLAPSATSGGFYSQLDFLTGVYEAGGRGSFDAVATHPYTWPDNPAISTPWNWLHNTVQLRDLMVSHGDADKQIWATEFGYPTNFGSRGITEVRQARYLQTGVDLWTSVDWTGPLFFYSFQDLTPRDADPENNFGLLRSDGTPKPALAVVMRIIAVGR